MKKLLLLLSIFTMLSCSNEELILPPDQDAANQLTQSSSLRATLEQIREKETTTGRAMTSELCFNFVYPITLGYNTSADVEVASYTDLIELLLNESLDSHITSISYPFEVELSADASVQTVANEDEFYTLVENCGYDHLEYEDVVDAVSDCFTINYPITVIVNDDEVTFDSEAMAQSYFLNNYQTITSVTIAYPLSVTLTADNSEFIATDDYEAIYLINDICGIN